ncbi:phage late control D family protein [Salmonella enterica subsp. houtenae]|nr:phage late control D family protein [Salmonella enterica subsp. houtenae]
MGRLLPLKTGTCCLFGRDREERQAASSCRLSPSRAKPVTVIGSPLLIVVPIPVLLASWLHTREPRKKETTRVKRRRKKATTPKEPEAKQGDYLVGNG